MKANELRIGNLIYGYSGRVCAISSINESFIKIRNDQDTILLCDCKPIPLTEDWLVKLGFESNPYQDRYENKVIQVECNKLRGYTELWIDGMPHIKYVHQLQNLYFALTGEELILKQ